MAIKNGFETTSIKKENQLTFPALYVWTVPGDACYGSVYIFINENECVSVTPGKSQKQTFIGELTSFVGGASSGGFIKCTDSRWRRLAIGERIFLENSD